ncbi:MAG: HD domain-containing protein [Bdellovibrionales bacterium]|nr:HD domain-containing protein [Bdellovibrionales bacterium]
MSEKIFVKDLVEKQTIQSVFLVRDKSLLTGKTGKPYLTLVLADKTGQVDGRIWDGAESWNEQFEADEFVQVKGFLQLFQNRRQFVVQSLEVVDPLSVELMHFLPSSLRSSESMMSELEQIMSTIKNPFIKELVNQTLNDNELRPLILTAPAAKTIHHAYLGGLLEHVLSISQVMVRIADHYKNLDKDLLLFGALFHDLGKIWELSFDRQIGYTDVGRLVGHIPLGSEYIEKKTSTIENFPYDLKNVLKHIVLSHHGRLEFGSPKRPKFLEALVVAYIDDLDSKIAALDEFIRGEKNLGNSWTRYNQMYDRYFYTSTMKDADEVERNES